MVLNERNWNVRITFNLSSKKLKVRLYYKEIHLCTQNKYSMQQKRIKVKHNLYFHTETKSK